MCKEKRKPHLNGIAHVFFYFVQGAIKWVIHNIFNAPGLPEKKKQKQKNISTSLPRVPRCFMIVITKRKKVSSES